MGKRVMRARQGIAVLAATLLPLVAFGQASSGTRISGGFEAITEPGGFFKLSFTCLGSPVCTGIYNATDKLPECSNVANYSDAITLTGVDLSRTGAVQGTVTITGADLTVQSPGPGPGGVCVFIRTPGSETQPYTGTWNGSTGTFAITFPGNQGQPLTVNGTFTATVSTVPPVFPMTVTGSITPTVANVQAQIQYRAQDVGSTGRVFVFALAPPGILKSAAAKAQHFGLIARDSANDASIPCVLAQLNPSGQLAGVTASTMQAYTSGVLSAQGQSVNILTNVSTPNVAGATFFVGYGADATSMINNGVNRDAVSVPSGVSCNPQPPQTGWWWNPAEGGRGFSIEAQGNNLFFAAFHYEANGRATWNVSPGPVSLGGSFFTSDLYNVTGGQTLGGPYRAGNAVKAGMLTLAFSDASHGIMTWPGGAVPIERMNLVPGGLAAAPQVNVPETGWWWNPQESGRGFFIEWQKGYADLAGYMYDDNGNPVWYISVFETPNPRTFNGAWWSFANGQSMSGVYKAPTQTSSNVAPVTIQFLTGDTAIMTLPNGRTTNLVRQRF